AVLERCLQLGRHRENDAAVRRAIAAARQGEGLTGDIVDAGAGGQREALGRKHLQLAPAARGARVEAQTAAERVVVRAGKRLARDADVVAACSEIHGCGPAALESARAALPTDVT